MSYIVDLKLSFKSTYACRSSQKKFGNLSIPLNFCPKKVLKIYLPLPAGLAGMGLIIYLPIPLFFSKKGFGNLPQRAGLARILSSKVKEFLINLIANEI